MKIWKSECSWVELWSSWGQLHSNWAAMCWVVTLHCNLTFCLLWDRQIILIFKALVLIAPTLIMLIILKFVLIHKLMQTNPSMRAHNYFLILKIEIYIVLSSLNQIACFLISRTLSQRELQRYNNTIWKT